MKRIFKLIDILKSLAVTVSLWTLCMAPVAQGAGAEKSNKELINRYLKETGLTTQQMTVGDYWAKVRHVYPEVLLKQLDPWMKAHKNDLMPKIEASTFKDSDNKEQVRLVLFKDGETHTLTFTGHEDTPLKVDNVTLTAQEVLNYKKFDRLAEKIATQDRSYKGAPAPTRLPAQKDPGAKVSAIKEKRFLKSREIVKLPLKQQMEYFLKMRQATEAADKVLDLASKSPGKGASFNFEKMEEFGAKGFSSLKMAAEALWNVLFGTPAYGQWAPGPQATDTQGPLDQAISNAMKKQSVDKSSSTNSGSKTTSIYRSHSKKNKYSSKKTTSNKKTTSESNVADGNPCIAAGWVASYSRGSCAHEVIGQKALLSQISDLESGVFPQEVVGKIKNCVNSNGTRGLPCNPLLFGFNPSAGPGTPFCIDNNPNTATKQCNEKAPLPSHKQSIIDSIAKAKGGNWKDGLCNITENEGTATVSQACADKLEKYTDQLKNHYLNAAKFCNGDKTFNDSINKDSWTTRSGLLGDQYEACENLKDRFFNLQVEAATPVDKCVGQPGTHDDGNGNCVKVEGVPSGDVVESLPPAKTIPEDTCSWFCRNKNWLIPLGVGAAAFGLVWWIVDSNKSKAAAPVYVPPAAPPLTTPVVTPPTGSTITPVPANNCPAPNVLTNGVCTTPVIVPPPAILNEGGSGNGPTGVSGIR